MEMNRRVFLAAASFAAFTACANKRNPVVHSPPVPSLPAFDAIPRLTPVRATPDRLFRITVCTRPFRAAGPRLDVERIGDKTVVHNYGHGGSGWSLSWGSSSIVAEKALATGTRDIAVIGCGALGLTSAILLQRAGAKVTIYAKERPPEVRSARATGSWTPDSRIALANSINADFPALWEKMARYSFLTYQSYLGMAGDPIEWTDRYMLSDGPYRPPQPTTPVPSLDFAHFFNRISDITPRSQEVPSGSHPFPTRTVRRTTSLTFNIASYSRQLVHDFLLEGGKIERVEFHQPSELAALPQKTIINATGYGARALWKDESIVPVRGQIAWLIPQPDVQYGVIYKNIYVLGRTDGIVVQDGGIGEMDGYNNPSEEPDRAAAEASVNTIAEMFSRMRV